MEIIAILVCIVFAMSFIQAGGAIVNLARLITLGVVGVLTVVCFLWWPFQTFAFWLFVLTVAGIMVTLATMVGLAVTLVLKVPFDVLLGRDGYGTPFVGLIGRVLLAILAAISAWVWWRGVSVYFLPFHEPDGVPAFYRMGLVYHWQFGLANILVYMLMEWTEPGNWGSWMPTFRKVQTFWNRHTSKPPASAQTEEPATAVPPRAPKDHTGEPAFDKYLKTAAAKARTARTGEGPCHPGCVTAGAKDEVGKVQVRYVDLRMRGTP